MPCLGPMGYDKETAERIKKERIGNEGPIYEFLKKIIIFKGNKQEFEELFGHECAIIDNGERDKNLTYNIYSDTPFSQYTPELRKKLVDEKVIGLICATPTSFYSAYSPNVYQGIPVKRK